MIEKKEIKREKLPKKSSLFAFFKIFCIFSHEHIQAKNNLCFKFSFHVEQFLENIFLCVIDKALNDHYIFKNYKHIFVYEKSLKRAFHTIFFIYHKNSQHDNTNSKAVLYSKTVFLLHKNQSESKIFILDDHYISIKYFFFLEY